MSVKESQPHFGLTGTLNVAAHCAAMNNIQQVSECMGW
jgi:hypothetical protein